MNNSKPSFSLLTHALQVLPAAAAPLTAPSATSPASSPTSYAPPAQKLCQIVTLCQVRALLLHAGNVDTATAHVTSRWAWQGVAAKTRSVHPALFKARSVEVSPGSAVLGDPAQRARSNLDLLGETRQLHRGEEGDCCELIVVARY